MQRRTLLTAAFSAAALSATGSFSARAAGTTSFTIGLSNGWVDSECGRR